MIGGVSVMVRASSSSSSERGYISTDCVKRKHPDMWLKGECGDAWQDTYPDGEVGGQLSGDVWPLKHHKPRKSPQSNANQPQKVPAAACHGVSPNPSVISTYLCPNGSALCRLSPPSWFSEQVMDRDAQQAAMLHGGCDVIVVYSHFTLKQLRLTRMWTYTGSMFRRQSLPVLMVSNCGSQFGRCQMSLTVSPTTDRMLVNYKLC